MQAVYLNPLTFAIAQEGLEEGIELGVQKGRQQALAQIVHNLHSNGLTTAVIAQMTGMSINDVERLLLS